MVAVIVVIVKTEQSPQASSCVFKRRTVALIYIMFSVGKMALNSLPKRSSVKGSGKGEEEQPTEWVVVSSTSKLFLQPPRHAVFDAAHSIYRMRIRNRLYLSSAKEEYVDCRKYSTHTSIWLFSLAAVSKSLSQIPFATLNHKAQPSHPPCSSIGRIVTSSFGPVTSVNTTSVLRSVLVVFHSPRSCLLESSN